MHRNDIARAIEQVLKEMPYTYSEEAKLLILETGEVESGYQYLYQMGSGPARSYFQVEPATALDCFENFIHYRSALRMYFKQYCGVPEHPSLAWLADSLVLNLRFAIAIVRVIYQRAPGQLPNGLEGRAAYWKQYYNTLLGKGTIAKYEQAASNLDVV